MRNYLANYNLLAVSANLREYELNTEQTLDTTLLVSVSDIINLEPRREDNTDEQTGKEEPDTVYNLGATSKGTLNFEKAQAQHFAFGYAYALGVVSSVAFGSGFKHTITPTSDITQPSFTAAQRYGKTIFKRRFASLFVDQLTATFAKDSWARLSLELRGTGKFTDNVTKETVQAPYNSTTLTLTSNGVEGADAQTRLDNVHLVRAKNPTTGEWVDVTVMDVSADTPAVLSIQAPGADTTITDFEVLYVPTEPAWCIFPSRVVEPPLRVSNLQVILGGKWDGTQFLGGHQIDTEIESIEHTINNNMIIEFRVGGSDKYANYAVRGGRVQALRLDRQARDFILQQRMKDTEYFGVRLVATGAEFEPGKNYQVDIVFPKCAVLTAPLSVNDKVVAEAGDLKVLEDDIYGSIVVKVTNMVSQYAQLIA